ncbi:MAG: hypothetical protein J6D21_06100 [Clostridia bacterium]|nr:hypothetical protein [Clostridia bacterium]
MYGRRDVSPDYDVYPKVVPADCESKITIRPIGEHAAFHADREYKIEVYQLTKGSVWTYGDVGQKAYPVTINEDGSVTLTHVFPEEQEHFIRILADGKRLVQLSVYSLRPDLYGRYAYMGDLHMHTFRSDGRQAPAVVAANYRKFGYDFMAMTDHRVYYASLEAIRAYADVPLDFTLFAGEEIHFTKDPVHIVNFGGRYSINGLWKHSPQYQIKGDDLNWRTVDGKDAPTPITEEEFNALIDARMEAMEDVPAGVDKRVYATCTWIFDQIRAAGGLGIFCHPYWISDVFEVPEALVEYMMEKQPFDAFEVLGGENYFEQNGFQTARYYSDRIKGRDYPIVGSTDSHSSVNNENAYVARTIVFSPSMEHDTLLGAIKDRYSVAVDGISKELRLVGEERLIRYGWFLLANYFPIHDELCFEEGRLMKIYATGSAEERADAARLLTAIHGRMDTLRKKYFGH